MALSFPSLSFLLTIFLLLASTGVFGATFTFVNQCEYTVWPGILANAAGPKLESTGFDLQSGSSRSFQAPTGWSGRFWGRTGCRFDDSGSGSCTTGDCGSGQVECDGLGANPPATLAEFTLGSGGGQDFYDVSLVDGYNLPMMVEASGGSGLCGSTGCSADLNQRCPAELRVGKGYACRSACEAFGSPEYCCSGPYSSPATCRPSPYSEMFKTACPKSYSYAYDDATSTFTCANADYTVTFCPSSPSRKSSTNVTVTPVAAPTTPVTTPTTPVTAPATSEPQSYGSGDGLVVDSDFSGSNSLSEGENGDAGAMLADGSWFADMAMGDSPRTLSPSALHILVLMLSLIYIAWSLS